MPLPNDNSAYSIICDGLEEAGKLQRGSIPDSELQAKARRRANDLITTWQTQGLKLWLQYDLPVPLTAGVNQYSLGPGGSVDMTKPMRVLDNGYYQDSFGNPRPLIMISRDEWTRLSNKVTQGAISSYFADKQQAQIVVGVWNTPDAFTATGVLHLLIQQRAANFINLTDDMSLPDEWRLALVWGLADEFTTGQPESVQQRCATKASTYFDALNNWDVEDASTKFEPDTRVQSYSGNFR